MHTILCVLIEILMEIGMLNFLIAIIGHCAEGRISLYLKGNVKSSSQICRYIPWYMNSKEVQSRYPKSNHVNI